MTPHVSFQFAKLYRHVVTIGAFVGLLVCMPEWKVVSNSREFNIGVPITNMSNEFSTGCKTCFTILALMRFGSCVCIHMILQAGQSFESSFTNRTFVWSFFRM